VLVLRGSQGQRYLRFVTMEFVNAADGLCLQGVKKISLNCRLELNDNSIYSE